MGFTNRTPSYLNDSTNLAVSAGLSLVSQVPRVKSCRPSGVNFQIRGSTEPAQLQLYVNATGFKFKVSLPRTLEPLAFHLCRSLDLC